MTKKWTAEHRAKFKATMRAKKKQLKAISSSTPSVIISDDWDLPQGILNVLKAKGASPFDVGIALIEVGKRLPRKGA